MSLGHQNAPYKISPWLHVINNPPKGVNPPPPMIDDWIEEIKDIIIKIRFFLINYNMVLKSAY